MMPVQIASDPAPQAPPIPTSTEADRPRFEQEQQSFHRAMPIQRLLGGGMSYADATALHKMADAGIDWISGGEWLGERNLRRAQGAATATTQRACLLFASACFRFAQMAIPIDTARKHGLYERMIAAFGTAGSLDVPAIEKHEIDWKSGKLCGWLLRPVAAIAPPVVIIMGGFDGWREEYHAGAAALVERGIAAFLMDGPGQGETRLFHKLYFDGDFPDAFTTAAGYLRGLDGIGDCVGIWGNSFGGFLAAATVAANPSFDALCVNGGTVRPLELPERFPRFFEKVAALIGSPTREAAQAIMDPLDLRADVAKIRCPLLQLHSVPDSVFLLENARLIHDDASSTDKTLLIWEDGDHCMYNHSDEKNMVVGDWFCRHLAGSASSRDGT
jgi:dienelactone hydrolase